MIQRIQSLYLLMTSILSLLFLNGSFFNFIKKTGVIVKITFNGIEEGSDGQGFSLSEKLLPLSIIILLITAISIITIFLL